jgi:hypothetical protein
VPPHDLDADQVAWRLRERIEARGVRRLVIDSATELKGGVAAPERAPMFMASLAAYLRSQQVTTYLTVDVPTLVGPELSFAGTPLVVLAENLLLLRYVEYQATLRRVLSVLKMRFSAFDQAVYEYTIVAARTSGAHRPPDCYRSPHGQGRAASARRRSARPPGHGRRRTHRTRGERMTATPAGPGGAARAAPGGAARAAPGGAPWWWTMNGRCARS